jgi:hypothetical protein
MISAGMWRALLKIDPVSVLLDAGNAAVSYFVHRDLLGEAVPPLHIVWELPLPRKILGKQQADGSWQYPGKKKDVYPPFHYNFVETFRQFRILIERYEFNRQHEAINKAATYLFSCQSAEGDFRGMIGNQYATYYTGAILSLLIRAGYEADPRVEKGMQWLLSMRQNDGGWTVPIITRRFSREMVYKLTSRNMEPVLPDRSQPFSHNWTNMVLQAFADHPEYRHTREVRIAGELLKSRFFKPDVYSSYRSAGYWVTFRFWWPNLLTALTALEKIGFSARDPDIQMALNWFIEHQASDGLWDMVNTGKREVKSSRNPEERLWLSLAVCRVLQSYYR